MVDVEAIENAEKKRVLSILNSPLAHRMTPLAEHLAFETRLPENEALTILWFAAESLRSPHGLDSPEHSVRVQ